MRRIFIFFVLLCVFALSSCGGVEIIYDTAEPSNAPPDGTVDFSLRIYRYEPSGWGVSLKKITGSAAADFSELLGGASATGEVTERLSDMESLDGVSPSELDGIVERGTVWVETEGVIYRAVADIESKYILCRAESYFGEGEVLVLPENFVAELYRLINCWPRDTWSGSYADGVLNMRHSYVAKTDVSAVVKDFWIDGGDPSKNYISLELTASTDMDLSVDLLCAQSDDNLYDMKTVRVALEASEPQTVKIPFSGVYKYRYFLTVTAANTRLSITVDPPSAR